MSCRAAKKKKLKGSSLVHGRWFCFQEMDTHLEQPHTGPARGGGGRGQIRHPLISPSRTSSNRSNGTLRSRWICGVLQVSSGKHEVGCKGQGRAAPLERRWVGEEPGRGTRAKPPNKGRGRWKALSARSALITRQNSSRLGRKRSYVHKSTKD